MDIRMLLQPVQHIAEASGSAHDMHRQAALLLQQSSQKLVTADAASLCTPPRLAQRSVLSLVVPSTLAAQ